MLMCARDGAMVCVVRDVHIRVLDLGGNDIQGTLENGTSHSLFLGVGSICVG